MSYRLYTVTLADLGTYVATVVACDAREAEGIAKTMLYEEATRLPPELSLVNRETSAQTEADPALNGEATRYTVAATYSLDFEVDIPALDPQAAVRHVRRIYQENCGPFEFDQCGDRVDNFKAREVQS